MILAGVAVRYRASPKERGDVLKKCSLALVFPQLAGFSFFRPSWPQQRLSDIWFTSLQGRASVWLVSVRCTRGNAEVLLQ